MNTKRAFSDIEYYLNEHLNDGITKDKVFEAIDKIKTSLQRGEKFEKMWGKLYEIASEFNFFPLMDKIQQKYFPK